MKNLREIYRYCFGEDGEFENALFSLCSDNLKVLECGEDVLSFLFLLPCELLVGENRYKAHYLFAAATHKDHRKKGYMGKLIEKIKLEAHGIIILRPATEELVNYYKKFEFAPFRGQDFSPEGITVKPLGNFALLAEKADKTTDGEFTLMGYNLPENIKEIYFPYTMP